MTQLKPYKMLLALLISLCSLSSLSVSAETPPVFDMFKVISSTQYGTELIELYHSANQDPQGTLTALEQLHSQGVIEANDYYQTIYYLTLYTIQFAQSEVEAAETTAKALYQFGLKQNQDWIIAEGLTLKGTLAARKSEGKQAHHFIKQAIEISERLHYDNLLARALNIRGILYSRSLDYELAIKDYQQAIRLVEHNNNADFTFKLYSNISVLYSMVADWTSAIEYNQKATELYLKSDNMSFEYLVILYSNASNNMLEINDMPAATEYSKKSTQVARESKNPQLIVNALMTETLMLVKQGLFVEAKVAALECIELSEQLHDPVPLNECLIGLGEISLSADDTKAAQDYAFQAMAGLKAIDNQDSLLKTHELLSRIYQQQQQYPAAIEHLTAYYEGTQQQLFNNREEQLFALKTQFEGQLQDEKIALLTAENKLKAASLEKKELQEKLWLLMLVIFAVGMALLIRRYLSSEKRADSLLTSNQSLYRASNFDQLTQLKNRRYIEHFVQHKLINTPDALYSVLMIDCDHFKRVNDTHGHDIGDEVLKALAQRLGACIRKGDVLARWGGEEFIILLQVDSEQSLPLAEVLPRFNQAVGNKPITVGSLTLEVTVSIGASQSISAKQLVVEWNEVLKRADIALYQAKQNGRNCAVVVDKEVI